MGVGGSRQYGFVKTTYDTQGRESGNEVSELDFDSTGVFDEMGKGA